MIISIICVMYIGNDAIIKKCTNIYSVYVCYIGNLQCIRTVHDMKTESELFGDNCIDYVYSTCNLSEIKGPHLLDIFKRIHLCLPLTN